MDTNESFRLVMARGPIPDKIFNLIGEEMTLGRDASNHITVNDPEVSRRHARLFAQGGVFVIEDLGSTNGTFVNGARITGPYILTDGDEIGIGETVGLVYQASPGTGMETVVAPDVAPEPVVAPPPPFEVQPQETPQIPFDSDPFPEPEPSAELAPPPFPEAEPYSSPPLFEPAEPTPAPPPPFAETPAPPPLMPAEPKPSRPPVSAIPAPPPAYEPPVEEKKSRKGLLIGCGCLALIFLCAIVSGFAYLLWEAPVEFWDDPLNNFESLFKPITGLILLFL